MPAKNRALQAIEYLTKAPGGTLTSLELARLLPTNHASRAITEAKKLGYRFELGWRRIAGDYYRTYKLADREKATEAIKPAYVFDPERQVFVYG
jgi:hypothetical protein